MELQERQINIVTLSCALVLVMGMWAVDISVSALLSGGYLTNGFWNSNPIIIYHLGLYAIIMSFLVGVMSLTYKRR